MDQLKTLIKIAEALDVTFNDALDLPASTEIAQTDDAIEEYKLIIAIRLGILNRQLAKAGIQPDLETGWSAINQRLCDVRKALG